MRERHDAKGFNRDRPAVAADQARRGEGGGDHAAFTDSAKSSNETGTPWLSAISLIGTQYLDGILRGPSAHALTDTGLIMMPRATSAEWTAWGPPNFLEAVYDPRSEEHTSELQSLMRISYAVFCLKKKKHNHKKLINQQVTQNTLTSKETTIP